jgi:hypothetical protein
VVVDETYIMKVVSEYVGVTNELLPKIWVFLRKFR